MARLGSAAFVAILAIGAALAWVGLQTAMSTTGPWSTYADQIATFTTIFLGIFIEAAPFLLLGTLASGLVEVFVNQDQLSRLIPRGPLRGALAGAALGLFFPVCECGVIPLARRLFRKGLPLSVGVAFLLAAPVLNPIVIASTLAAFGLGQVLLLRLGLTLAVAVITGLVFAVQRHPERLLRPAAWAPISGGSVAPPRLGVKLSALPGYRERLRQALLIAADEFFEMGRYLVAGALLAALMQTAVPQSALLALGGGPVVSVVVLMALAVVLSICSTVDAFIALSFAGTFTSGSILAFLVFGPMVDIKSTLMYLGVFRRRAVAYLVALPLMLITIAAIYINLNTPW